MSQITLRSPENSLLQVVIKLTQLDVVLCYFFFLFRFLSENAEAITTEGASQVFFFLSDSKVY